MNDSSTVKQESRSPATPLLHPKDFWALLGLAMLGVRLVQGWIYWGGASRRLIYSVGKLDPSSHAYMAYKMNHAVPGAIFGTDQALTYVLHHPTLLYISIILFTLVELAVGVGLILGLMTRFLGLVSVGLSISLMLMFGWLGSTCVDEWTMASDSFAMGLGIMLAGGGTWWSLDHWIARQYPTLAKRRWFPWLFSGPLPLPTLLRLGKVFGVLAIVFTVGFYAYLRGAVVTPLTARTNPKHHHIELSAPRLNPDGDIEFNAYVNAGPDTQGAYVIEASVLNEAGQVVESWNGKELRDLPANNIKNAFDYSVFKPTKYGLIGILGARATIVLPHHDVLKLDPGKYSLMLLSIDGKKWKIPVTIGPS